MVVTGPGLLILRQFRDTLQRLGKGGVQFSRFGKSLHGFINAAKLGQAIGFAVLIPGLLQAQGFRQAGLMLRIRWFYGQCALELLQGQLNFAFFQERSSPLFILCGSPFPGQRVFFLQGNIKRRVFESLPIGQTRLLPLAGSQMLVPALDVAGFKMRAARKEQYREGDEKHP